MKTATIVVTTAARRLARLHNDRVRGGFGGNGFILVARDGSGGAWYSDNARPAMGGNVRVNIRWQRITAAEAQEILDQTERRA